MTELITTAFLLAWNAPTTTIYQNGLATYYAPGLMEQVAENRELSLEGYEGGVALNRAGDLNRSVWLDWGDGEIAGPYLVVDCAQRDHFVERERQGRIVEVSAEVAQAHGFFEVGPVDVGVWFVEPPWLRNVKER